MVGQATAPAAHRLPDRRYVLAAVFYVISFIGGDDHTWAEQSLHTGTYLFIGGAGVWVLTAVTGWDAWKSSRPELKARRTINSHGTIMITVTLLALAYIGWRLNHHNGPHITRPSDSSSCRWSSR